jgi:hypothetical protein
MQIEVVYLKRIANICQRRLGDAPTIPTNVQEARAWWTNQVRGFGFTVSINGQPLGSPEEVGQLWIQSVIFHSSDLETRRRFEAMGSLELIVNEHAFLDYVTETTKYILNLGRVVKMCLTEGYFN